MVAPVALYPDPLLQDVLMAATYPAEVAEAAQFVRNHPNLTGKALDDAIAGRHWDISVGALVHATGAIKLMGEDPEWTRDLGDAFLAQQNDVLNAVQVMRNRACDHGTLKTTSQQKVITEPAPPRAGPRYAGAPPPYYVVPPPARIVRIVPVSPTELFVPVYNPLVVFGPPPVVVYYPPLFPAVAVDVAPFVTFGIGLSIGALFVGDLDWDHHVIYPYRWGGGYYAGDRYWRDGYASHVTPWQHDPFHRRDVSYRSTTVQRFYRGGGAGALAAARGGAGGGRGVQAAVPGSAAREGGAGHGGHGRSDAAATRGGTNHESGSGRHAAPVSSHARGPAAAAGQHAAGGPHGGQAHATGSRHGAVARATGGPHGAGPHVTGAPHGGSRMSAGPHGGPSQMMSGHHGGGAQIARAPHGGGSPMMGGAHGMHGGGSHSAGAAAHPSGGGGHAGVAGGGHGRGGH